MSNTSVKTAIEISKLPALGTITGTLQLPVSQGNLKSYKVTADQLISYAGTVLISDTVTSLSKTWSSQKISDALASVEPSITAGTSSQYFRGDKTWQTLNTTAVAEGTNLYFTNDRADARITLQKGAANGLTPLGPDAKIPSAYIPAVAITDTFVVNSQAAMLALSTAEAGDIAVRTDINKTFILKGSNYADIADWQELLSPTDTVQSVNGQVGNVMLTTTDISEGTNLYYTQARFNSAFSAKTTSDLSEGSNLYYTQARFDSAFGGKTTSNLSEGTNLYYTQARFDSAFTAKSTSDLSEGTNQYFTTARALAALTGAISTYTTGNATAARVFYANSAGKMATSSLFWDDTNLSLGIGAAPGGNALAISKHQNAISRALIYNDTIGTSGGSGFFCDSNTLGGYLQIRNGSYSGGLAGRVVVGSNSATDGLSLFAEKTGGDIHFHTNGDTTAKAILSSSGNLVIGSTTDQGARFEVHGGAIYFSRPSVAHGMTGLVPTNVFGRLINNNTNGGLNVAGYSNDATEGGLYLLGHIGAASSTIPAVQFYGAVKNGTGRAAVAATDLLFEWVNAGSVRARMLGNGSLSIGITSNPTAWLHLQKSSNSAGSAAIKIDTTGALMTTAELGAIEAVSNFLYYSPAAGIRHQIRTESRTAVSANYTMLVTDRKIGVTSTTLPRTITLVAANAVPGGFQITISDESNAASAVNTITISPNGTDTIIGGNTITSAGGSRTLYSDGVSKWQNM